MIQTVPEFDDASAFERFALATVFPLVGATSGSASLDLRSSPGNITVELTSVIGGRDSACRDLINDLRPLLFGAAWKVLDLILELALYQGGMRPMNNGKWSITEKQKHATAGAGSGLAVCADVEVWSRVTRLYAATVEARHCLVHRRFLLTSAGDMSEIRNIQGRMCPDITALEQTAFCRLAQSLASLVIRGCLVGRDRLNVIWWLDQLANHHALTVIGGAPNRVVEVVKVNAVRTGATWEVDVQDAQQRASESFPGRRCFDIEVYFPGTGLPPLLGRLEEAPHNAHVVIDPANPPNWAM